MKPPSALARENAPAGTIRQWLEVLSILVPVSDAVVVGAGTGTGEWVRFLRKIDVRNAILFEADPSRFDILQRISSDHPGWLLRKGLVAANSGLARFHRTSLPSENGSVDPEVIKALWPNLRITETLELETTPLSDLLDSHSSSASWLFLDCLSACSIVEGTGTALDKVALIVARATTGNATAAGCDSTSCDHLATSLASRGFTCLAFEPGHHPGAGHGLFLRDISTRAWEIETLLGSAQGNAPSVEKAFSIRNSRSPVSPVAAYYLQLEKREEPPPFVLLDSKSLPRSGLHYLKSRLSSLLGSRFSFCEWYHEPGCCQSFPCALDCFVTHAERTGELRLRLIKSHDFALTDPILETGPHMQRLVLVRDPIFMLSSWFELEQFETNKAGLLEAGIHVDKIWFLHEKEIIAAATSFVDRKFIDPPPEDTDAWLADKVSYMGNFVRKWVNPEMQSPLEHVHLVRYDRIDSFINDLIEPYRNFIPQETRDALDQSKMRANDSFKARTDPFSVKSKRISSFLIENRSLFERAANEIIACDKYGFFSR